MSIGKKYVVGYQLSVKGDVRIISLTNLSRERESLLIGYGQLKIHSTLRREEKRGT